MAKTDQVPRWQDIGLSKIDVGTSGQTSSEGDFDLDDFSTVVETLDQDPEPEQAPIEAMDFAKSFAGGGVEAAGHAVRGAPEVVDSLVKGSPQLSMLSKVNDFAAGIADRVVPGYADRREETRKSNQGLVNTAADKIQEGADSILGSRTDAAKLAEKHSTPDGDITELDSWSMGQDPSISGYALQGTKLMGQFSLQIASAFLTRGRSVATQIAAASGTGTAQGVGAAVVEARRYAMKTPSDELAKESGVFRDLLRDMPEKQAREELAELTGKWAAKFTMPVSMMGGAATGAVLGKAANSLFGSMQTRVARSAAAGMVSGTEEAIQEVGEGMATAGGINVGADADRSLTEGSFGNAALGFLGGTGPGAVSGAMTDAAPSPDDTRTNADDEIAEEPADEPVSAGTDIATREPVNSAEWEVVYDDDGDDSGGAIVGRRAPAESVGAIGEGDVVSKTGRPFMLRSTAVKAAAKVKGTVEPVDGGFIVRTKKQRQEDERLVEAAKTIDEGANEAATSPENDLPEPSDAQKKAGVYKKGRIKVNGIAIGIENPAGSVRSGTDPDGNKWSNTLHQHYGDITGTTGMDGDQVDVFVKPGIDAEQDGPVFIVDQVDPKTRKPDEHKVMVGFESADEATKAYLSNYEKNWQGLGNITEMDRTQFNDWVKNGDHSKPVGAESLDQKGSSGRVSSPVQTVQKPDSDGTKATAGPAANPPSLTKRANAAIKRAKTKKKAKPGNPNTFLRMIADQGGIAIASQSDVAGENTGKANPFIPGKGKLFRKNGMQLDELVNAAVESGFMTQSEVDSVLDNGGVNRFTELVQQALKGESVFTNADADAAIQSEEDERYLDQSLTAMELLGADVSGITTIDEAHAFEEKHLDRLVNRASQEASIEVKDEAAKHVSAQDLGEEWIDSAIRAKLAEEIDKGAVEQATALAEDPVDFDRRIEEIIRNDRSNRSETDESSAKPGRDKSLAGHDGRATRKTRQTPERQPADGFSLDQPTQEGLEAEAAKRSKEDAAKAKRDAAPDPGEFTLTGSDSAADNAIARGQQELISEPAKPPSILKRANDAIKRANAPKKAPAKADESPSTPKRSKAWESLQYAMLDELTAEEIAGQPLPKSWPAPKVKKLIDEGVAPWKVNYIKAARDALGPKPKNEFKVDDWAEQAIDLRNFAGEMLDGYFDNEADARAAAALLEGGKEIIAAAESSSKPSALKRANDAVKKGKAASARKKRFSSNKIFTENAVEKARARLKKKLSNLNSGLDPEMLADGITIAGAYIESGARDFSEYAQLMIEDMGDGIKPYLLAFFEGVRAWPGVDSRFMSTPFKAALLYKKLLEQGDASSTAGNLESDRSQSNTDQQAVGEADGVVESSGRSGRDGRRTRERVFTPDSESLLTGRAPDGGKRGDQSVDSENGRSGAEDGAARSGDSTGSDETGPVRDSGLDRSERTQAAGNTASEPSLADKLKAQKSAEHIDVVVADRSNIDDTLPFLLSGQRDDVKFAEDRFATTNGHGVLFTNGTGTGKTYTGLGIAKRFQRQGKDNILIVVPSDKIANDWSDSANNLSLNVTALKDTNDAGSGPSITTYANIRDNHALADRDWDLVITDESHYLMQSEVGKVTGSLKTVRALTGHPEGSLHRARMIHRDLYEEILALREKGAGSKTSTPEQSKELEALNTEFSDKHRTIKEQMASTPRPKALFLSATPFAYAKTIDYANGYLFEYQESTDGSGRGYNQTDGRESFFVSNFGFRMRYNKLTQPDAEVDNSIMERGFNSRLKKEGALSSRVLDVPFDYDRRFVGVDSKIGHRIDQALEWLSENAPHDLIQEINKKSFNYLKRRFLLEAIKADASVYLVEEHLAMGRKVIVFHDYKKGGNELHPFVLHTGSFSKMDDPTATQAVYSQFKREFQDVMDYGFSGMQSPVDLYRNRFGDDVGIFNGDVPKKERRAIVKQFQDDSSGKNLILVQSDAGKEGISLHDTTGNMQRVLINLGLPTKPTAAIQQEGRSYRVGQASDAIFRYMNTGTSWERWAFASTIAERSSTAENLAMGEYARGLKDSFIQAFEATDSYAPGHEGEGKGGKQADREMAQALSPFDRAKSYYFAQQKKTSRTKSAEGRDYFATPEPLGLKMVEWARLPENGRILEPSAGHGAIARWFPDNATKTAVEPSGELNSRLALAFDGKIVRGTFESFHISNKFDAIVMNPPFGTAGKTAMEHVEKAFNHLAPGGRIVALIPNGSSMNKRLDKWLYGEDSKGRTLNDANLVGDILLPAATFERAGTKVAARIVIIENGGNTQQRSQRDLTAINSVKDLFDRIENMDSAEKVESNAAPQAVAVPTISGAFKTSTNRHIKTGKTMYTASMPGYLERSKYLDLQAKAKAHGGRYSSYKNATTGAVPGFVFSSEEKRQAFIEQVDSESNANLSDDALTQEFVGSRRGFIVGSAATAAAAAGSRPIVSRTVGDNTTLGRATPVPEEIMSQNVPAAAEKYLRRRGGGTSFNGARKIKKALQSVIDDGPPEVRQLAKKILRLMPDSDVLIKVDDSSHVNAHGAVDFLGKIARLRLFTAGDRRGLSLETFLHEALHLVVAARYKSLSVSMFRSNDKVIGVDAPNAADAMAQLIAIWTEFKTAAPNWRARKELKESDPRLYSSIKEAMRSPDEFLVRTQSDPVLQKWMAETPYRGTTLWGRFKDWVKYSLFGFSRKGEDPSWLDAALLAADEFLDSSSNDAPDFQYLRKISEKIRRKKETHKREFVEENQSNKGVDLRGSLTDRLVQRAGAKWIADRWMSPLWDRVTRMGDKNGIGRKIKANLVHDYGLDEPYIDARDQKRAQVNAHLRKSKNLIDMLDGLDREQSRVAYFWMTEDSLPADEQAAMDRLPEASKAVLRQMKQLVHELGKEAVAVGLLSEDSFNRNKFTYLHRTYEKYVVANPTKRNWKESAALRGDLFKGRGIRHNIDQDRLVQHVSEVSQGDKLERLELRDKKGRLRDVAYVLPGSRPDKLKGWTSDGIWEARFMGSPTSTKVGMWRDMNKAERLRLGEIEEIRFAMAKTVLAGIQDVENAKFLAWAAKEYGQDPDVIESSGRTLHDANANYFANAGYKPEDWVRVPETKIAGTKLKKFGVLAGKAVPAPIWNDIRSQFGSSPEGMWKAYDATLRAWKISKTALSPAVHMNNVMANMVLADLADIGARDLVKAAEVLVAAHKGDKGAQALVDQFKDSGAELGSLVAQELHLDTVQKMLNDIRQMDDDNAMMTVSSAVSMMAHGQLRDGFVGLKRSKLAKLGKKPFNAMIRAYQLEDSFFRLAAFMAEKKRGATDIQAGRHARESFMDYNINAPFIQSLRRGPLPFIAFSYRAIPLVAKAAVTKPWKFMKYKAWMVAANAMAYSMLGGDGDEEEERALLPEEKSGSVFGIAPRLVRMPWNGVDESPVFLDIRRWLPAGDVFDLHQSKSVIPLPGWLTPGGPMVLMSEILLNKSAFTGRPVYKPTDTGYERSLKGLDHVFKFIVPNLPLPNPLGFMFNNSIATPGIFQTWSWKGLSRAGRGEVDAFQRERSTSQAALSSIGVKLASYPKDAATRNIGFDAGAQQREIKRQIQSIFRRKSRGGLSQEDAERLSGREVQKLRKLNDDINKKLNAGR